MSKRTPKIYKNVKSSHTLTEILRDLREYVENQGTGRTVLVDSVYKTRDLKTVQTTSLYPPWVFGYQVIPIDEENGFFLRNIYLKIPDQDILEVPEDELESIYGSIYDALIDKGNDMPSIHHIAKDAIKISQNFAVSFLHEFNPGVVVPRGPKAKLNFAKRIDDDIFKALTGMDEKRIIYGGNKGH